MDETEKLGAAFHEAAHTIMAAQLGAKIEAVLIAGDASGWEGELKASMGGQTGPERTRRIFQVAVAGPFGQVKFRANLLWPTAQFDRGSPLDSALAVIRAGKLKKAASLAFGFVAEYGTRHKMLVRDSDDVVDLAMLQDLVKEIHDEELLELMRRTCDVLDVRTVWSAVGELATMLHAQNCLSGEEAGMILRRHGLA